MLTSHEQLVETVFHIGQWIQEHVQSKDYGTFCGPLEIPGGPPMVHVENHCFTASTPHWKKFSKK